MAQASTHIRNDSGVSVNSVLIHDNPPSPTLTNPDMIMPIPPWLRDQVDNHPHPLLEPENPLSQTLSNSSRSSERTSGLSAGEVGIATAVLMPQRLSARPPTSIYGPSTPIPTYTGYEHGAPLSDIYEESEATTTPKSTRHRSPSPPGLTEKNKNVTPTRPALRHKKRISSLSTSSSGGSDVGDWENFDSAKVLSERVTADLAQLKREETLEVDDAAGTSRRQSREEEELAALNARAEQILEHARQRLTNMEDNLKTARNSVIMPQKSPTLAGEHQPVGGLYRSISAAGATRLSKKMLPIRTSTSLQHMRGLSDAGVTSTSNRLSRLPEVRSASAMDYNSSSKYSVFPENSPSSATKVQPSPASTQSYNSPLRPLGEENPSSSTAETTPESVKAPPMKGLGILSAAAASRENLTSPVDRPSARETPTPTQLMRPGSVASTSSARELKDQMLDLKTRIADLKSKTQADNLRRRSLQALRSSSPFTNAQPEQWYTSSPGYKEAGGPISANAGVGYKGPTSPTAQQPAGQENINGHGHDSLPVTPVNAKLLDVDRITPDSERRILSSARTDRNTPTLAHHAHTPRSDELEHEQEEREMEPSVVQYDDISDERDALAEESEDETDRIAANEEEQIYLNEVLEESLRDAEVEPEVPAIPDAYINGPDIQPQRHEDRLDAFDYENMFLHSAMGTYTGRSLNGSDPGSEEESDDGDDDDDDDDDSVETSRADVRTPVDDVHGSSGQDDVEVEPTDEEMAEAMVDAKSAGVGLQSTPYATAAGSTHAYMNGSTQHELHESPKPRAHARSQSLESVSTSATFETATEGAGNHDETPNEIYNWDPTPSSSLGYSPTSYQPYRSLHNSPTTPRHGFSSPQAGGRSTPRAAKSPLADSPLQTSQHYEIRYDREKALGSPGLGLGVVGAENAQFINDNGVPERFQGRPSPSHSRQGSGASQNHRPESQATMVLASPAKGHKRHPSNRRSPLTPTTMAANGPSHGSPVVVTVTSSPQRKVVINRALQQPESYVLEPQMAGSPPNMPLPPPPASGAALQAQMASPKQVLVKRSGSGQKRTPTTPQGPYAASAQQQQRRQLKTPPVLREAEPVPVPPHPGPIPNTEILMESLIKLADPSFNLAPGIKFEEIDKNLVLGLLGAVGGVCNNILRASVQSGSPAMGKTQAEALVTMLRHRLDDASTILEGREQRGRR